MSTVLLSTMSDRLTWVSCKSSFRALYATLLLIGWKWKLVKQVYLLNNFFGFSSKLRGLSIICRENKGRMTDNNEAYDGLSVFTYNRATLSRKNWLKQIAIERRKISHKCTEFHRATSKQGTLKLIVATLLLTYGNSATRALLLTVA